MVEVNPYRSAYIPTPDRSKQTFDELTAWIPQEQRQQEINNEQAYRNASMRRESERDKNLDERDRIGQEQRARQILMSDRREGERNDTTRMGEQRRYHTEMMDRAKLEDAEHERLIHNLAYANTPEERAYAAAELQRHGYQMPEALYGDWQRNGSAVPIVPPDAAPAGQNAAAPYDPTLGGMYLPGDGPTPGITHARPMAVAPLGRGSAGAAALDNQLNGIDQTYSKGLGIAPGMPYMPGRPAIPTTQVAQSNAMLSPDDPYNQLVK